MSQPRRTAGEYAFAVACLLAYSLARHLGAWPARIQLPTMAEKAR